MRRRILATLLTLILGSGGGCIPSCDGNSGGSVNVGDNGDGEPWDPDAGEGPPDPPFDSVGEGPGETVSGGERLTVPFNLPGPGCPYGVHPTDWSIYDGTKKRCLRPGYLCPTLKHPNMICGREKFVYWAIRMHTGMPIAQRRAMAEWAKARP